MLNLPHLRVEIVQLVDDGSFDELRRQRLACVLINVLLPEALVIVPDVASLPIRAGYARGQRRCCRLCNYDRRSDAGADRLSWPFVAAAFRRAGVVDAPLGEVLDESTKTAEQLLIY